METIRGVITGKTITEGQSPQGKAWTRCTFQINSKNYATFDSDITKACNIGDTVDMSGEQDGKYWKMSNMVKCDTETINTLPTKQTELIKNDVSKPRTTRTAVEVTASSLIHDAVRLAGTMEQFDDACIKVWDRYKNLKERLAE